VNPHPLFSYGPVLFVGGSFVFSGLLTPRAMRFAKRKLGPFRREFSLRAACMLSIIAVWWLIGSALGVALLALPPPQSDERAPGSYVDAAVLAHMVPTTAPAASEQLVVRLEHGAAASRWDPPGSREAWLVLAARIDPGTDRAIARLADSGFRTQAGRFTLAHPTGPACEVGLDALAEAVQGGALQELMEACRNAPGDPIARAAFKMGDFMKAVGPETESIISRQPRAPDGEAGCFAQGPDLPDASTPMCRLVHGEVHGHARGQAIEGLELEQPFAAKWLAAVRAELGQPMADEAMWTIDARELITRPFPAVMDEPISVYEDIREQGSGQLTPGQSGWVRMAIAAERSAMGRHRDAALIVEEAHEQFQLGTGASAEERQHAARLAAAIAIRAGDVARAERHVGELPAGDPLHGDLAWARGEAALAFDTAPDWMALTAESAWLAAALEAQPAIEAGDLWRLVRVPESQRAPLREWLRECFPACAGCGFFAQLDRLSVRLDGARALGDAKLVSAIEPIVQRFEAVFLNRLLALSLRAADPEPALAGR